MHTADTDSTDTIFIADFGESPSVFINGKEEPIYRYAVWSERKIKIIEYGDDLDYLRKKYGYDTRIRVLNYTAFRDEAV